MQNRLPSIQLLGACRSCGRQMQLDPAGQWFCECCPAPIRIERPTGPPHPINTSFGFGSMQYSGTRRDSATPYALSESTETDSDTMLSAVPSPSFTTSIGSPTFRAKQIVDHLHHGSQGHHSRFASPSPDSGSGPDSSRDSAQRRGKKMAKERVNRGDLQTTTQDMEDLLGCYLGPVFGSRVNKQTSGNANSSGLRFKKIDVLRYFLAVSAGMMQDQYSHAIATGTEAELDEKMRRYIDQYCRSGDPFYGTWLYNPERRCSHDLRGHDPKRCTTHGRPNWWDCHKVEVNGVFERNKRAFIRKHRR